MCVSVTVLTDRDCCSVVIDAWQKMGQEKKLSSSIVDQLLDTLSRCQPYEELTNVDSKTKKPARRALLVPFTVRPLNACLSCHSADVKSFVHCTSFL